MPLDPVFDWVEDDYWMRGKQVREGEPPVNERRRFYYYSVWEAREALLWMGKPLEQALRPCSDPRLVFRPHYIITRLLEPGTEHSLPRITSSRPKNRAGGHERCPGK